LNTLTEARSGETRETMHRSGNRKEIALELDDEVVSIGL
jgi:hypothetical protein